jgi:AraC family transcriptional regulator
MTGEIELRTLPPIRVAYMRHVGPYGSPGIAALWPRFEAWCATRGLLRDGRPMCGVAQDNSNITLPERTRYDACIEVDAAFRESADVSVQVVRGGRFGCVRVHGTADEIRAAWVRLLGRALPEAGLVPDLAPAIEIYEAGFAVGAATLTCTLCMPLRSESTHVSGRRY